MRRHTSVTLSSRTEKSSGNSWTLHLQLPSLHALPPYSLSSNAPINTMLPISDMEKVVGMCEDNWASLALDYNTHCRWEWKGITWRKFYFYVKILEKSSRRYIQNWIFGEWLDRKSHWGTDYKNSYKKNIYGGLLRKNSELRKYSEPRISPQWRICRNKTHELTLLTIYHLVPNEVNIPIKQIIRYLLALQSRPVSWNDRRKEDCIPKDM